MRPPSQQNRLALGLLRSHVSRSSDTPCLRQFSYKQPRQFLLANQGSPRPQLPFLYPSGARPTTGQLFRLFSISANHKKFIKQTAWDTVRWTIVIFIGTTCFTIASYGFLSEQQERAFPSPHEWSLITRFRFRRGKWYQVPEHDEDHGIQTGWWSVYDELDHALKRLENPNQDGAGLIAQERAKEGESSKISFNITAKSEEWRQGYYEVLLGMAEAAERVEGCMTTKSRKFVWGAEFFESPSNPHPRKPLPDMRPVPDEADRIPFADTPDVFYTKIMTTKGFTTYQRLSAALGYANWLDYKKQPEAAEQVYRQGLDIAIAGLPTRDPSSVINPDTLVLSSTAPKSAITRNIVLAATNWATFLAGQGRLNSALPIFVSLLRARISADVDPLPAAEPPRDYSGIGTLLSLLSEPDYPPVPPSGDEPLLRKETDQCDEAVLKNYVGELLFATAGSSATQRREGLAWVRDSVSTAKMAQSLPSIERNETIRKKCEVCEEIGLESWGKIMTYLAADATEQRDAAKAGGLTRLYWKLKGTQALEEEVENLEGESDGVMLRLSKLRSKVQKERQAALDKKYARIFVF